jgi:hypothetical protein
MQKSVSHTVLCFSISFPPVFVSGLRSVPLLVVAAGLIFFVDCPRSRHSIFLLRSRFAAVICSSFSVEIASGTGPVAAWVSRDSFLRSFSASSVKRAGDFSISRRLRLCPNQKQESLWFASPCSMIRGAQARKDFFSPPEHRTVFWFSRSRPALVSRVICFPGQQFLLPLEVCTSLQICAQTVPVGIFSV